MSFAPKSAPSTADKTSLGITIVLGAVAAGWTVVHAILRIVEIAPNRDVPVTASLADNAGSAPIGPGGSAVDIVIHQGTFLVSDMPGITLISLLLAEIISALAVVGVVVCVCLLCAELMKGRAFSRRSLLAVGWGTFIALGGWLGTWLFSTMGANGGVAAISDHDASAATTQIDLTTPFALAALGALALAFQLGNRLQRETEGLV